MEPDRPVLPYVPFKTFLAALETLSAAMPNQLDRSVWPSYSGAIQGQLLNAFRFLGLMDEERAPTAALRNLAAPDGDRRAALRALLEQRYQPLISLDLTRTSPRQLEDALRKYGLSGATHKKVLSFFLQAAQYAGLPLSVLLKAKTRTASFGHRRAPEPAKPPAPAAASSMTKTVKLKTGGAVTLIAEIDLFTLGSDDRAFVFDLVDRMQRYDH